MSKHPVEDDEDCLKKSRVGVGHCVDACGASGSQLIRSAASGGEGFHVDVVVKEISRLYYWI